MNHKRSMSLTVSFLPVALILIFACGNPSETAPGVAKVASEDHQYQLRLDQVVAPIQPTMYGIFFEDINFAADGGIYAEMVKNRSFEFLEPLMGWAQPASDRFSMNAKSGFASAMNHGTDAANKIFLRANIYADQGYNLVNEGFKGMGFKAGLKYNLSLKARQIEGASNLHIELVDSSNTVLAQAPITVSGKDWKTYTAELTPSAQAMKGKLNIRFEGKGIVDLDFISLFPADTWKNRPNGLRADLVQLLADLKPGFLRFPGGCIVEGRTLARRYQWKKTVGKVEEREFLINRWNTEFKHRPAPDYFQSFGLGFFEYFQLAEDIGATPLPILSCGMACQFNTGEMVPLEELQPFVQDALDLIEFANGPVTSAWGKLRAEMGHPETFNMRLIGIGNEQWGPEYIERYNVFEKAIKSKYPEITIVSGSGPFPDGEMFDYGMQELKKLNAEIIDEHYYKNPEWFLEHADRYDAYDRNGPKIFAGEYAAQSVATASPENINNWNCALSEAAFMTGLERNAEVVHMTSYAPLFAHAEGWQWTPDLIWFNNLESYGTANYYVQKMFSNHAGTHVLQVLEDGRPVIGKRGMYATAALDENSQELILKIVNATAAVQKISLSMEGRKKTAETGQWMVLKSNDKEMANSFEAPRQIFPVERTIDLGSGMMALEADPLSFSVLRVKYQ